MSRRQKTNSNNLSTLNTFNTPSFIMGRVGDAILDKSHPEYKGKDSIGVIFFSKVRNDDTSANPKTLIPALPALPFINAIPLKNEIVQLFAGPSSKIYNKINGERSRQAYYYYPPLNVHNSSEHNALPSERDTPKNITSNQEATRGIQQNTTTTTTTRTVREGQIRTNQIDRKKDINDDGSFTITITLENVETLEQATGIGTSTREYIAERKAEMNALKQLAPVVEQTTTTSEDGVDLGEFEDKGLKNLQPFTGDVSFEGRYGQSIRFGASNKQGANNWSDNDSEGEPVTIIANGSSIPIDGDASLEDINSLNASMWMLSNQNVSNLQVSSNNTQTLGVEFEEPTTEQVLIEDTPDPIIIPDPIPLVEEIETEEEEIVEETQAEPPAFDPQTLTTDQDPIFALLDEAVEEGAIEEFTPEIYFLSFTEPANEEDASPTYTNSNAPVGSRDNPSPLMTQRHDYTSLKDRWDSGETVIARNYKGQPLTIPRPARIVPSSNSGGRNIKYLWIHETAQPLSCNPVDIIATHFLPDNTRGKKPWKTAGYNITIPANIDPGLAVRFYNDSVATSGVGGPLSFTELEQTQNVAPDFWKVCSRKTNANAVNISWIGGTQLSPIDITRSQAYTLQNLILAYIEKYPNIQVGGHNQMGGLPEVARTPRSTACPGFFVPRYLELLGIDEKNIFREGVYGQVDGEAPNGKKGGIDYLQNAKLVYQRANG